jgi:Ca-activated chloride channel family protein
MKGYQKWILAAGLAFAGILAVKTWRDPDFWRTADKRGDAFLRRGDFPKAAKAYADPARIGVAEYRNGDFKEAAQAFGRVPGAVGAFDQGNALLMHGAYDPAIASYDRALGFRPGWAAAEENKALAILRRDKIQNAGDKAAEAPGDEPDAIAFDRKGENKTVPPTEPDQAGVASDVAIRALWLRRVQTTPGDFLRAKFAFQAQAAEATAAAPTGKEEK